MCGQCMVSVAQLDSVGPPVPTWTRRCSRREGAAVSWRLSCLLRPVSPWGSSRSADLAVQESFWLRGEDVCESRSWHCRGEDRGPPEHVRLTLGSRDLAWEGA